MVHNEPKKQRNNFMALLNFIVDPVVILDEKELFLAVNEAFVDMIDVSKKKLIDLIFLGLGILDSKNRASIKRFQKKIKRLYVGFYELNFIDKIDKEQCVELKTKEIKYTLRFSDCLLINVFLYSLFSIHNS